MMNNPEQQFKAWLEGTLTREEAALFLEQIEQNSVYAGLVDELLRQRPFSAPGNEELKERIYRKISEQRFVQPAPVRKLFSRKQWWAAAAIFILLGSATWWFSTKQPKEEVPSVVTNNSNLPLPGGDKAVLVLANGEKIILDSSAEGRLAQQEGATVYKSGSGQISYEKNNSPNGITEKTVTNVLTTPRGGQYSLTLADGTKVWLNAESSITYPTSFKGNERIVSITGEAYFEVAKMTDQKGKGRMPFKVKIEGPRKMEITVLGTHFNVNAYADEPVVKTTLLEGSVRLQKNNDRYLLQPGQQAQFNTSDVKIITDIDPEEVLAWKNGTFYFEHTSLQTVMRQLSRWYDVSVEYRGEIADMKFGGEIPRSTSLDQVLKILEKSKLHFIVEGKKIIVIP